MFSNLYYQGSYFIKSGHWLLFLVIFWIDNRSELFASFHAIMAIIDWFRSTESKTDTFLKKTVVVEITKTS